MDKVCFGSGGDLMQIHHITRHRFGFGVHEELGPSFFPVDCPGRLRVKQTSNLPSSVPLESIPSPELIFSFSRAFPARIYTLVSIPCVSLSSKLANFCCCWSSTMSLVLSCSFFTSYKQPLCHHSIASSKCTGERYFH